LEDKPESVATHMYWAVQNCDKNTDKLKASLDNIVQHYQNKHDQCNSSSRCKKDPQYEPGHIVLTDPVAVSFLTRTVRSCVLYTHPQDFVHGRDTFYVESFNNVMNIFQDKRICFSSTVYDMRTKLAVLHWNCNVDRGHTSIQQGKGKSSRSKCGKKVLKSLSYAYCSVLWNSYMDAVYSSL